MSTRKLVLSLIVVVLAVVGCSIFEQPEVTTLGTLNLSQLATIPTPAASDDIVMVRDTSAGVTYKSQLGSLFNGIDIDLGESDLDATNIDASGTLNADGATTLGSSLGVAGPTTVVTLTASGPVTFTDDMRVVGESIVVSLTATGPVSVTSLTVVNETDMRGDIANSTGDVTLADDVVITGTLNVDGAATMAAITSDGAITTSSTLGSAGDAIFAADANVSVDLDVGGDTTVVAITASGAGDFETTLNVDGASTMGAITSDGAITTSSTIGSAGEATFAIGVQSGDGTVGAPAYGYVADSNTGMYRTGANTLGLATDGTLAVTVDASQEVGIGVSDPDELVELYKVGIQLKLSGGAADYATFATAADGALTITTVDDDATQANIIFAPDGHVGIGTTSPGERLEVRKDNAATGVRVWAYDDSPNGQDTYIQFGNKINGAFPDDEWYMGLDADDGKAFKIGYGGGAWSIPGDDDALTIDTSGTVHANKELKVGASGTFSDNLTFTGAGKGLQHGYVWGNEITWTQASAGLNTWYNISHASIADGPLNGVGHSGSGVLTVTVAGMYMADWDGDAEADAANQHIQITLSVDGTATEFGETHFVTIGANRESTVSITAILDLTAGQTVQIAIRTTDAGTPDLFVDHYHLRLVQIAGT